MSSKTTRELIRDFNLAFGRPVHATAYTPTVSERLLLGKLLLEETIETITLGLGLTIRQNDGGGIYDLDGPLTLEHDEGRVYDPVETADGQGDVNVVNHFMAHWLGFNLDAVTEYINDSNMSKLDPETGEAIINGVTPGYRAPGTSDTQADSEAEEGFDPSKPIGKILKSSSFWDAKPGIPAILSEGNEA